MRDRQRQRETGKIDGENKKNKLRHRKMRQRKRMTQTRHYIDRQTAREEERQMEDMETDKEERKQRYGQTLDRGPQQTDRHRRITDTERPTDMEETAVITHLWS